MTSLHYHIKGNIPYLFFAYLPPKSFLYLLSFFFAHTPICPTATTAKNTVLKLQLTIEIPIHAIVSNM